MAAKLSWLVAVFVILSFLLGIIGFLLIERQKPYEAITNTALMLSTTAPGRSVQTREGEVFITLYSLYTALLFLVLFPLLIAVMIRFTFRISSDIL